METVDCLVVGAGVVGLAIARRFALAGMETIILERERTFGQGTSSRNSEVVHAGIYYPKDGIRARLCVAGRKALYAYCAERGVAHKRIGKLIVATNERQLADIASIKRRAALNGVDDLHEIDAAEAKRLEPALSCLGALVSPSTGIIDSHGLMTALLGDAEAAGAVLAVLSPFEGARPLEGGGFEIAVGGAEPTRIRARHLVNSAGLEAWAVARGIHGMPENLIPRRRLAKGNYYTVAGRVPFSRLVYPVPEDGGLGVHLTLDLGGRGRFGPDVEWVDHIEYSVDPKRADRFYAAVRTYWPELPDGSLTPDYCGIRPKLTGPGETPAEFVIQGQREHGMAGLINLFGIESPGLTSCLAIADHVAETAGL